MMTTKRTRIGRHYRPALTPTPEELSWLRADRAANPFFGFIPRRLERLLDLWAEHGAAIRREWGGTVPADLPFGHPAAR